MKKKQFFISLLLLFLCLPVFAADLSMEEAVQLANQELREQGLGYDYFDVEKTVESVWNEHHLLVYGSPHGTFKNGEYRYIGQTPSIDGLHGDDMPNPNYKDDDPATTLINNWHWIKYPWSKDYVSENRFNNNPELRPFIVQALKDKYGNLFNKNDTTHWEEYAAILQPKTSVTPGLGRIWHNWNGKAWYITFIIPNELKKVVDIEAVEILVDSTNVKVNVPQNSTAVFRNNGTETEVFQAQVTVGEYMIVNDQCEILAGETKEIPFTWVADSAGPWQLKIEAVPLPEEEIIDNNIKTLTITADNIAKVVPPCKPHNSSGNWSASYRYYVSRTCHDKDGDSYECGYWKSHTETYTENLKTDVYINTKQGNPNGGRESRGAWEIIPWAQNNGLNPNYVTRAGYGFEVAVETTYTNDWENYWSPCDFGPKGYKVEGPKKVEVEFYDTKGAFVTKTPLEPISGTPGGQGKVTWVIPQSTYTFKDGTKVTERKHYTNVNIPDGHFTCRVLVDYCGHTSVSTCQDVYVIIFGDMYDDIYSRPDL